MPDSPIKSKLLNLLKDVQRGKVARLGFGLTDDDSARTTTFLVIAELPSADEGAVRAVAAVGADAIIVPAGAVGADGALERTRSAAGDVVLGIGIGGRDRGEVDQLDRLARAGCDFVVAAPEHAPARLLANERMARVLLIAADLPASLLRAVGEMDVEVVAGGPDPARQGADDLTVFDLMHYRQITGFVRQPTLIVAEQAKAIDALQLLRDLGALGVIVPSGQLSGGADEVGATVARYRAAADQVRRPRHRHGSESVTLPRPGPAVPFGGEEDEPDEEPDEDE